ncbi:MAG: thiazole biosynthesis adenylyltransferase ThiF, partial [Polyangiaceae bacterium]
SESLEAVGAPTHNKFMLKCRLRESNGAKQNDLELTLFADGRAIVGGTNDAGVARSVYAKYVGS